MHADDAGDSLREAREELRVGPASHLSLQPNLAALDGELQAGLVEPERLEQQLADLPFDLLVASGERTDEIGPRDDPDQRALVVDHGKPLDLKRRHQPGRFGHALLGAHGDRRCAHRLRRGARGELLPDLDKAVFNAQSGAVIGPITTKNGWHILKVEQRLPSEVPAFESVKDKLRKDVSEETFQRDYKAYIERLRKDAFIQINDENIPTA